MGLEAECTVIWRGRKAKGKALLETAEILVRGELKLKIPRDRITTVVVEGGELRVTADGETATFALGAAAEKWAQKLATVKSRLDKLGVAPGLSTAVVGVEDAAFHDELRSRIGAFDGAIGEARELLFFGVHAEADLERFPALVLALAPSGGLWVIRPKGSAEVSEAKVRAAARGAGLVDVKVASFSPTHTAERYVIPARDRPKAPARRTGGQPRAAPITG
jgi:hypothetical protein